MKTKIHPKYQQAKIACVCGNSFVAGSTLPQINVEICSKCHPFFTGEMRYVDTLGRVDKFMAKRKAASTHQKSKKKKQTTQTAHAKSLKEMLIVTPTATQ